ncbi:arginine deiminase [Salipaludibacillus aurantiacus]|uniref:Arginine deiminase n=1 Tax=Salipaludibacillus aurantiacus TaxID=1601833 RepID=A0A1H9WYY0_9BACI|nr:arginine deiminase [Salipaludibacillus aurantiacus]SES38867.1 arginine deiminase [Salipaludibacillus aurantiacus]
MYPIHVDSEIGRLQTVMLHRPGKEVENLTPDSLSKLLFDDIPYLPAIQKEHDYFANTLRNRGIEVLYLDTLMVESLSDKEKRETFVDQLLSESKQMVNGSSQLLKEYLLSFDTKQMVSEVISGVLKKDLPEQAKKHLYEIMADHHPFYLDPMPNLYFTRDPAAAIGNGISLNKMREPARRRESLFMQFILNYHPRFSQYSIPLWINRDYPFPIEGGDELVLSDKVLAIGVSERTSARAVEKIAVNLFKSNSTIEKVVAVEIPKCRAFMHLDTVFTMIDHDQFTIHPEILDKDGNMNIFILEKGEDDEPVSITRRDNLADTLKEVLELPEINLIPCGGGDEIASAREQWNDGSNTLAIAPGVVVTYERNYVSNQIMRENGIEVIEVLSSELVRGRGGPRCMSMPLKRDLISKN